MGNPPIGYFFAFFRKNCRFVSLLGASWAVFGVVLRKICEILCFFSIFERFLEVLGPGSGLKMLLGPVRSFSRSRFLISSILDPFRVNFGILGRPLYCVFLQDRDSVLLAD